MGDPWKMIAAGTTRAIDEGEVRRALSILVGPNDTHELRALPSGRSRIIRGNDLGAALRYVRELADENVYYTLNPVRPDLTKSANNGDVVRRVRILIDVDPDKPREHKDSSASDEEKEHARAVAEAILHDLAARGWPAPISIDSGNGWHLVYGVDLPNDKLSQQWISKALKALARAYEGRGASVDIKVHNASRIAKLPGTWARKGPDTPQRPHRICRLISVPVASGVVPVGLIRDLATAYEDLVGDAKEDVVLASPAPQSWTMKAGNADAAYARSALEREVGRVATAGSERNNTLYEAALKLGGLIAAGCLDESEVRRQLEAAARACGLPDPADPTEIARAIDNGLVVGKTTPRVIPEQPQKGKAKGQPAPPKPQLDESERLVVLGSEVEPEDVNWLWENRVPYGFITLFAGRTSVGKSFAALDLAARLSRGLPMPGATTNDGQVRKTLFISEDPLAQMLVPRLLAMDADTSEVGFMTWKAMAAYELADIDMLAKSSDQVGGASLVVIDPPQNFLGEMDEHKNSEVRSVLMKVVAWLEGREVACIIITHLNKAGKGIEALQRVIGSVAWTTTPRIAHGFTVDPDDTSRCLFAPLKNNLGPVPKPLGYRIVPVDGSAKVEWLGEVDTNADQALAGEKAQPRRIVASKWLIDKFREKREWPSDELFAAARNEGLSRDAIFEAKNTLGLPRCRQVVEQNGNRCWVWWVPPDWAHFREDGGD